ncbi:MAG: DUF924 domain-containing protein [Bdellovibrionales bacterium]|nr:DUF924 domain-containing protein [Massilia sp.]
MTAQDVLDFWFLPPGSEGYGGARAEWFRKDDAFDALIRERFGPLVEQAIGGGLHEWDGQGPRQALARILLLDQFTRNACRGKAASFAGDALAQDAAQRLLESGAEGELLPVQLWFAYLPFEHAESMAMQEQSVALFSALAAANPQLDGALDYARKHRAVIERFGRSPGRNAALGRVSTPEEVAYLAQGGSGF